MRPVTVEGDQVGILVAAEITLQMGMAQAAEMKEDKSAIGIKRSIEVKEMAKVEITVATDTEIPAEIVGGVVVVMRQIGPQENLRPDNQHVRMITNFLRLWPHRGEVAVVTFPARWTSHRPTFPLRHLGLPHRDKDHLTTTEEEEEDTNLGLGPRGGMGGIISVEAEEKGK